MTTTSRTKRSGRNHTWVEVQRQRLEQASSRKRSGSLAPEDGIGALVGGTLGLVVGAVMGVVAIAVTDPAQTNGPVLLVVGACLVGVSAGALIGMLVVGGHARQAQSEFAELRDDALGEAPVRGSIEPEPPATAGSSVFDRPVVDERH